MLRSMKRKENGGSVLLLDRVLAEPCEPGFPDAEIITSSDSWAQYLHDDFRRLAFTEAVPFEVTNVADYLRQSIPLDHYWTLADFPGFIPPFRSTWFEFKYQGSDCFRTGVHVLTETNEDDTLTLFFFVYAEVIAGAPVQAGVTVILHATKEGLAFGEGEDKSDVLFRVPGELVGHGEIADSEKFATFSRACYFDCFPVMLAISLLNCRNVAQRELKNSRQVVRYAERHNIPVAKTYRVIEIQPFIQEVAAASPGHGPHYSREAAKIIRGHFKDYSEHGLFGKLKGRFWWHQRIQGPVARDFHYEMAHKGAALSANWKPSEDSKFTP